MCRAERKSLRAAAFYVTKKASPCFILRLPPKGKAINKVKF